MKYNQYGQGIYVDISCQSHTGSIHKRPGIQIRLSVLKGSLMSPYTLVAGDKGIIYYTQSNRDYIRVY